MLSFDTGLTKWLREEHGAVVINTLLGTDTTRPCEDTSSLRSITESLAQNLLNAPMSRECWGSLEYWLDYAIDTCRDFSIDAVIMTVHLGCKNIWGVAKLFKDRLSDEVGIPCLIAEADFCDGRVFSAENIRSRIAEFFEIFFP
jgi:hypothetical protein